MIRFESAQRAMDWVIGERWKGEKNGLTNTRALLRALGDPQNAMGKILHVAGTNGKGSTCAFLERALRECGYQTGLFTSPYLCRFQERIRVNGAPVDDETLIDIASRVREAAEKLAGEGIRSTTFEILTAMACLCFALRRTEYAVMEVGMGGRLDSTNVLTPAVSVIAAIGMDHMSRLGNTIEEIAGEKAGIIKPGVPAAVLSQTSSVMRVFEEAARQNGAPLFETAQPQILQINARGAAFCVDLPSFGLIRQQIALPGAHQVQNAVLALTALDRLSLPMKKASEGMAQTLWPGRLEWIQNILIDGAHNPQGAQSLAQYVKEYLSGKKLVLLTGMMQDKQLDACAKIFAGFASDVVTTQVNWPRAVDAGELAQKYPRGARAVRDIPSALETARALAGANGCVIVAGSIYLAGDVRNLLLPGDDGSL